MRARIADREAWELRLTLLAPPADAADPQGAEELAEELARAKGLLLRVWERLGEQLSLSDALRLDNSAADLAEVEALIEEVNDYL